MSKAIVEFLANLQDQRPAEIPWAKYNRHSWYIDLSLPQSVMEVFYPNPAVWFVRRPR